MAKGVGNRGGSGGNPPPPPPPGPTPQQQAAQQAVTEASNVFFDNLSDGLKEAGRLAQPLQNAMQGLQTVFQGLTAVSSVAGLVLDGFSNAVQSVAGKISGLVEKVNPGVVDQFQRAFSAFQSQLGEVFLPLLQGLGQLVQTVANALAGLDPQGRSFILFLTGAAAGLGVAIAVGGIFLTVIGSVVGAMIAGAAAGEALALALDVATLGFGSIGQVIGAAVGLAAGGAGVAGSGAVGAGAGAVAALGVAGGTIEEFMKVFEPFLTTLVGAFNSAGATILPQLAGAIDEVMPPLGELFDQLVQYLPLLGDVLATFAAQVIPELVKIAALFAKELLPVAFIMAYVAKEAITVAGALLQLGRVLAELAVNASPLLTVLSVFRPTQKKGNTGAAPAPVTGASYTGIEDLFRKSQEAAILGRPAGGNPTKDALLDKEVQKHWATAVADALANVLPTAVGSGFVGAMGRATSRSQ